MANLPPFPFSLFVYNARFANNKLMFSLYKIVSGIIGSQRLQSVSAKYLLFAYCYQSTVEALLVTVSKRFYFFICLYLMYERNQRSNVAGGKTIEW